jgi:hypothetical protein
VYTLTFKPTSPTAFDLCEDAATPRYNLVKASADTLALLDTLAQVELATASRLKPYKLWLLTLKVRLS